VCVWEGGELEGFEVRVLHLLGAVPLEPCPQLFCFVLLYSPGRPGTLDPPALTSLVLGV
jgi:hypothetical protein